MKKKEKLMKFKVSTVEKLYISKMSDIIFQTYIQFRYKQENK